MTIKISQKRMAEHLRESLACWDDVYLTVPEGDKENLFVWTGRTYTDSRGKEHQFLTLPPIERTAQACENLDWHVVGVTDKYPIMGLAIRVTRD